jgi:glyoxylase-like metal-dependent hydrolase (beta-lactamase superfamily II)
MATAIIPGVTELLVPIPNNPLENTNVYLVRGDDGYLLIDTGWNSDHALRALGKELEDAGAGFRDIKQIIVTHAHFDHYGLVGRLKQQTKATVYLHQRDEEIFRTRYAITEEFMRQSEAWFHANGVPRTELPVTRMPFGGMSAGGIPPQPDVKLNGGETISTGIFNLEVIWTPGHSPGSICLYERKHRLLFSGDHILPVITPNISLPPKSDGNPLGEFLKSLELVRKLDVGTVLPAHENIFHDLPKRIDEILHHHEFRNQEILKALDTGAKTAYEVSNYITWMPQLGGVHFRDLMPGDKRAAVSETLAHLRAMTVNGRVKVNMRNNMYYYGRA